MKMSRKTWPCPLICFMDLWLKYYDWTSNLKWGENLGYFEFFPEAGRIVFSVSNFGMLPEFREKQDPNRRLIKLSIIICDTLWYNKVYWFINRQKRATQDINKILVFAYLCIGRCLHTRIYLMLFEQTSNIEKICRHILFSY